MYFTADNSTYSSAIKAKAISLPPGRYVVEMDITAPLGYHLHLLSSTCGFTVGTQEEILPLLASESLRFKQFGAAFLRRLLQFLSTFAEVGGENPPPEPKEEVDLCETCSKMELCQCVCVNRRLVVDYTGWTKIPERYTFALNEVYEYISPPICCEGRGGKGKCDGDDGEGGGGCCFGRDGCRAECRVNFDEKWDSMLRGFYSFARRVLPAAQQTAELLFALRAAFLDLKTERIFEVEAYQPSAKDKGKADGEKGEGVQEQEMPQTKVSLDEEAKNVAARGIQKSIKG